MKADPRLVGLVQSLRSTAEAALGEGSSPLRLPHAQDHAARLKTAERSLGLLQMLAQKTAGNLSDDERAILLEALSQVEAKLAAFAARGAEA